MGCEGELGASTGQYRAGCMWAYEVGPEYPDLRARKNNSETKRNEVERVRNYDDEACKGKDIQIHLD